MWYKPCLFITFLFLFSCGGGGGGGSNDVISSSQAAPATPSATTELSSNLSIVDVGDSITVTWSSTNASTCSASGDWSGTKSTSGNENIILNEAKSYSFSLNCSGALKTLNISASYAISGVLYSDAPSTYTVFIDQNINGILDPNELSATPSDDGSYRISTSNEEQFNCQRYYPLVAKGLDFSYVTQNLKGNTKDNNISPFTSLLGEYFRIMNFGDDPSTATQSNNCGTLAKYRLNNFKFASTFSNEQVENFDGIAWENINIEPALDEVGNMVINKDRGKDIDLVLKSLGRIFQEVSDDLSNSKLVTSGLTMKGNAGLESSNYRIFLNSSSYPNPSTDETPAVNNLAAVSFPASINFWGEAKNAQGPWKNRFKIHADLHINYSDEIILDTENCWLNFDSLCKISPNLNNLLDYSSAFKLKDIYSVETSRGLERVMKISTVDDDFKCATSKNVWLDNSATSDSFYEYYGFSEYYPSTFSISNFECSTFGNPSRRELVKGKVLDNHSYYTELFVNNPSSLGIFADLNDFDYESIALNYNSNSIDSIPSIFIEYFSNLSYDFDQVVSLNDYFVNSSTFNRDYGIYIEHIDADFDKTYLLYWPDYNHYYCVSDDIEDNKTEINGEDMGYYSNTTGQTIEYVKSYCFERLKEGHDIQDVNPKKWDLSTPDEKLLEESPYRGLIDPNE